MGKNSVEPMRAGPEVAPLHADDAAEENEGTVLKELFASGAINPEQFRNAVTLAAAQDMDAASLTAARNAHFTDFMSARPWALRSLVGESDERRVERIMRATNTGDEFQALRYLREFRTEEAAVQALRESLDWRREVLEPLLRGPKRIVDELVKECVWLLPKPSRHGNPIVVSNSRKFVRFDAEFSGTEEERAAMHARMGLAFMFVVEKAVSCSGNPLAEVELIMNRETAALPAGGLRMIRNMRARVQYMGTMLRKHYPGRIRRCHMYPAGPLLSIAVRATGAMSSLKFSTVTMSREDMREHYGAETLPRQLGGDTQYDFSLADVMLPTMKLQDFVASLQQMRFDDEGMEHKYTAWAHSAERKMRPRALLGAALVAVGAVVVRWTQQQRRGGSEGLGALPALGTTVLAAMWLLLLLGARYALQMRTNLAPCCVGRFNRFSSVTFAVLLQVPAMYRFGHIIAAGGGGGTCTVAAAEAAEAARAFEAVCFVLALLGFVACFSPKPASVGWQALCAAWVCWAAPALAEFGASGGDGGVGGGGCGDGLLSGVPLFACHLVGLVLLLLMGLTNMSLDEASREVFRRDQRQGQALQSVQEELRSLRAQTRASPIMCLDKSMRITVWNDSMAALTGWHQQDVVGKDIVELVSGSPEKRHAVRSGMDAVLTQVPLLATD